MQTIKVVNQSTACLDTFEVLVNSFNQVPVRYRTYADACADLNRLYFGHPEYATAIWELQMIYCPTRLTVPIKES